MTSKKNILFLPGDGIGPEVSAEAEKVLVHISRLHHICLLYTSPSPRDGLLSRMPSSA